MTGDKGLIKGYTDGPTINVPVWIAVLAPGILMAIVFVAGLLIGLDRGWDVGVKAKMGDINSAFKEEMSTGRTFSIAGIKGVQFMPRAGDGNINYTIAGAEGTGRVKR